jgi:hypothetical protein
MNTTPLETEMMPVDARCWGRARTHDGKNRRAISNAVETEAKADNGMILLGRTI